ncbi:MAG: RCC1 domain-containing protein [Roseiflexaceae bacterium]
MTASKTLTASKTPTQAPVLYYYGVSAGDGYSTCALANQNAYCWGYNGEGQLGNGTTAVRVKAPVAVTMPAGVQFSKISTSSYHSCALTTTGTVYCWGKGSLLGNGTGTNADPDSRIPVPVTMPAGVTFTTIATSNWLSCGLASGGDLYCWGDSDGPHTAQPTHLVGSNYPNLKFAKLMEHGVSNTLCGLDAIGQAYCWGENGYGQLGWPGANAYEYYPVRVVAVDFSVDPLFPAPILFDSISVGRWHTCATTSNRSAVYCWGRNRNGQLGDGTTTNRSLPVRINKPSTIVAPNWDTGSITLGEEHTCVTAVHGTYCWGLNDYGQLGNGSYNNSNIPVLVQVPNVLNDIFVQISAGTWYTCAITSTTYAYCWGSNDYGQLGDNTSDDRVFPVPVVQPNGSLPPPTPTAGAGSP